MPTFHVVSDPVRPLFHPETPLEARSPETLLKTGALQAAILKSAYFSSIATDEKGVIQIFNIGAERMLGYSALDVLNRATPADLSDPVELNERANALSLEFDTVIQTGFEALVFKAARGIEDIYPLTYICKDGTRMPAIVSVTSLRDGNDTTRVLRRTAQLLKANEELEAFGYSVSHDLRSPLNSIDGFATLLERAVGPALDDQGRHYLDRIHAGTRQMSILIEGMLTLSKLSRQPLRLDAVDLSASCHQVEYRLKEREPDRNAVVRIEEGLLVHGDSSLLQSVMSNLISNAWKFTARKKTAEIDISCAVSPEGVRVYTVKDNGAGFDMAYSHKLFGTFERLHSPTDFSGTGVGLAIVQRIITRHGGKVWAHSVEGHGASFFFTLGAL